MACKYKENLCARISAGAHGGQALSILESGTGIQKHGIRQKLRPAGMILCYPVVTSERIGMKEVFKTCGEVERKEWEKISIEKQVGIHCPPLFYMAYVYR